MSFLTKGPSQDFSGTYNDHKAEGTYICRRCNAPLFDSTHKFENSCGWPCFDDAIQDAMLKELDNRAGLIRTEFLSTKVLLVANQKQEQAFAC